MDFLDYPEVVFGSGVDVGQLSKTLDHIVGFSIWYDKFTVQNSKWLWFVKDIITAINKDKALCGVFCLYPTYVAGILSRVEEINFYILSNNKLKFLDYIEKCISGKQCTVFSHKYDEYHFRLSSGEESVNLKFEIRTMDGKLPTELTFAYSIINKIRLSCLTYGIFCINNRVAYITNEVLNSKHECVLER